MVKNTELGDNGAAVDLVGHDEATLCLASE